MNFSRGPPLSLRTQVSAWSLSRTPSRKCSLADGHRACADAAQPVACPMCARASALPVARAPPRRHAHAISLARASAHLIRPKLFDTMTTTSQVDYASSHGLTTTPRNSNGQPLRAHVGVRCSGAEPPKLAQVSATRTGQLLVSRRKRSMAIFTRKGIS